MVKYCERRTLPPPLGCDANSLHEATRIGKLSTFLNLILAISLRITPIFVTSTTQVVLDITLENTLMNRLVENWMVSDKPSK